MAVFDITLADMARRHPMAAVIVDATQQEGC